MPVLGNTKHELFAQGIVAGKSNRDAYKSAFPKCKKDEAADASAGKLLARPDVDARVKELLGAAAEKVGVTAEMVIAELAKIGFADIRQVVTWRPEITTVAALDEDSEPQQVLQSRVLVTDSATLNPDTAAAVAEVSQGANGVLRIKMHDKPSALEKLGRALGIFKDKLQVEGEIKTANAPTPDKVMDDLQEIFGADAAQPAPRRDPVVRGKAPGRSRKKPRAPTPGKAVARKE